MARVLGRVGVVVLVLTAIACLTLLVGARTGWSSPGWLSLSKPPPPQVTNERSSPSKPPDRGEVLPAVAGVLQRWDHRRASAYAAGDVGALQRLYIRGSQVGARDVRLMRSYAARGLVVTVLRMRLLSVDVVRADPHRLVLRVEERLVRATARSESDSSVRRRLPTDNPSTHVVTLVRRSHSRWQVSSVR